MLVGSLRRRPVTGQSVVLSNAGVPLSYAPDAKSWPVRPVAVCVAVSSRPVTWIWMVKLPLSIADEIVSDGVGRLAAVWMIGRMTWPNELSMPFVPSAWFCLGAPVWSVQTSAESFVVVLPSRL